MSGASITGWGTALPLRELTNRQLAEQLGLDEEWILSRTGISSRRTGGTTSELAASAAQRALQMAGVPGSDIDAVILATTSPDPAGGTVLAVAERLGIPGAASELNAACSGFVFGLVQAHGLIRLGARRVLLIGAETMRRLTDERDRDTTILFGDGAGAVVLEAGPGDQLKAFDMGGDGTARQLLFAPHGGFMAMDGREIFRRAVRVMVSTAQTSLERAGLEASDLDLVVPHQANIRIIEAACERLGVGAERVATVLNWTGNTSAASIPLALVDALESGRVRKGDNVLLVGFGAGMSWGSAVLQWTGRCVGMAQAQ